MPSASPSVEDYVKAIYKARTEASEVTPQEIADRLGISGAAASKMIRRLSELNLVNYVPYQGIRLTEAGEKMALEIVRHHRLLELYLMEALGYRWDQVHDEAERLEHHISEEFEERIDALLGYPTRDPHGDPIPTRDGRVADSSHRSLAEQDAPAVLTIERVSDRDASFLRHLNDLGLFPGTTIELIEQEPFGGAFIVRIGDRSIRVAPQAAHQIYVAPVILEEKSSPQ